MYTFREYQQQEQELIFAKFGSAQALAVGTFLAEKAVREGLAVAIFIEINRHVLYRFANDGATPNNYSWIERKKQVVDRFQMSSGALAAKLRERKQTFQNLYGESLEYAVTPGAFPIRVEGIGVIGSIGVSGLDSDRDHELILEGLRYLSCKQQKDRES